MFRTSWIDKKDGERTEEEKAAQADFHIAMKKVEAGTARETICALRQVVSEMTLEAATQFLHRLHRALDEQERRRKSKPKQGNTKQPDQFDVALETFQRKIHKDFPKDANRVAVLIECHKWLDESLEVPAEVRKDRTGKSLASLGQGLEARLKNEEGSLELLRRLSQSTAVRSRPSAPPRPLKVVSES
jgi:hypothetical protein